MCFTRDSEQLFGADGYIVSRLFGQALLHFRRKQSPKGVTISRCYAAEYSANAAGYAVQRRRAHHDRTAIKASEKVGQLAERRARKKHGRNAGGKRAADTEAAAPAGGRGEVESRESERTTSASL